MPATCHRCGSAAAPSIFFPEVGTHFGLVPLVLAPGPAGDGDVTGKGPTADGNAMGEGLPGASDAAGEGPTRDGDAVGKGPAGDPAGPGDATCCLDAGPHLSPPARLPFLVGSQNPVR